MTLFTTIYSFLYQFGDSFAYLTLSALGLAVIFGMMGVINLAHGEFVMCGAYITILTAKAGLPLPLAMLTGAMTAACVGAILEYLIVRHLYNRLFDSIVATWAVSLITQQTMLIFAGPSSKVCRHRSVPLNWATTLSLRTAPCCPFLRLRCWPLSICCSFAPTTASTPGPRYRTRKWPSAWACERPVSIP